MGTEHEGRLAHVEYSTRKAESRINVNNILAAMGVTTLSILVGASRRQIDEVALSELACSIPCLITSALAYSKFAYRSESEAHVWNKLAWLTHSTGYLLVLASVVILLFRNGHHVAAYLAYATMNLLFVADAIVDVRLKPARLREKTSKLAYYVTILFAGGLLPLLLS